MHTLKQNYMVQQAKRQMKGPGKYCDSILGPCQQKTLSKISNQEGFHNEIIVL